MYWPHRALLSSHRIVIHLVILELFIAFKWLESETNLNADEFMFFLSPLAIEWVSVYACLLRYVCNEVKKIKPESRTCYTFSGSVCVVHFGQFASRVYLSPWSKSIKNISVFSPRCNISVLIGVVS